MLQQFAFAQSKLDRLANMRGKPEEIKKLRESGAVSCIWICGDAMRFVGGAPDYAAPSADQNCVFLGQENSGKIWLAAACEASDSLKSVRSVMIDGLLPPEELSIVAQARSLVHWHESHGFCARCGKASRIMDAGYRRHCEACGADHFPRTDPVVIMAVVKDDRLLLGRQKSWPPGMFSVLAGFVEPGETIEQAVAREVMEEVGVKLGKINYVTSQPWPFPASLMIGMIAEAKTETLTIDEHELETARWFGRDEVELMLKGKHPDGLTASRPDAIAWHLATDALAHMKS